MNHFAAIASFVTASGFTSMASAEHHPKAYVGTAQTPATVTAQLDGRTADDSRKAQ